jgi:hypothetical protein
MEPLPAPRRAMILEGVTRDSWIPGSHPCASLSSWL